MSIFEMSVLALWLMLLVVLLLLSTVLRRLGDHEQRLGAFVLPSPGLSTGDEVPRFTATTADGCEVSRTAPSGDGTVMGFFSAHCSACRDQLPAFREASAVAATRGLQVLAVIDGTHQESGHILEELGPSVMAILAPYGESTLLADLQVNTFPSYLVMGADGVVVATAHLPSELAAALELSVQGIDAVPP